MSDIYYTPPKKEKKISSKVLKMLDVFYNFNIVGM